MVVLWSSILTTEAYHADTKGKRDRANGRLLRAARAATPRTDNQMLMPLGTAGSCPSISAIGNQIVAALER